MAFQAIAAPQTHTGWTHTRKVVRAKQTELDRLRFADVAEEYQRKKAERKRWLATLPPLNSRDLVRVIGTPFVTEVDKIIERYGHETRYSLVGIDKAYLRDNLVKINPTVYPGHRSVKSPQVTGLVYHNKANIAFIEAHNLKPPQRKPVVDPAERAAVLRVRLARIEEATPEGLAA